MSGEKEGKYDAALGQVLDSLNAESGMLVVLDGDKGAGFSVRAPLDLILAMPTMLRRLADAIEAQNREHSCHDTTH